MVDIVKTHLLRACINFGCLNFAKINSILTPLVEANNMEKFDRNRLKELIELINEDINFLQQRLTLIKHPVVGEEFLVFSYTSELKVLKEHSPHSEEARQYFAKLLEAAANGEEYAIGSMEIYSVANTLPEAVLKKLSKVGMLHFVKKWTEQGYFLKNEEKIYLGPRAIVEFENYLIRNFSDNIKLCPLCQTIVLWDIKCELCDTKFHLACIRKYLIKKTNCPECQQKWSTRLSRSQ